jgi:hypothetical protein
VNDEPFENDYDQSNFEYELLESHLENESEDGSGDSIENDNLVEDAVIDDSKKNKRKKKLRESVKFARGVVFYKRRPFKRVRFYEEEPQVCKSSEYQRFRYKSIILLVQFLLQYYC